MEPDRRCPRCGQIIPWGSERCPLCSPTRSYLWSVRRDTLLAIVFVLLVLLFVVTGTVVGRYHSFEKALAQDWYRQGQQALGAGHAPAALADFSNALAYSRDNPLYQLRLAQALAATGRVAEARAYLLSIRERDPGNGPVNLELARLAATEHNISDAVEYYHNAVYCEWEGDPVVQRRAVRLELVKFLLDSDQGAAARVELIGVAGNLPPDAPLHIQVGKLLMQAGAYDDALALFRQAVSVEPRSAAALAGAGECYFYTGRYALAEPYLNHALRRDPKLTSVAAVRDTVRAVLELDPFARWLGEQQRMERAHRDFDLAMTRLQACADQRGLDLKAAGSDPLQTLYAQAEVLKPSLQQRTFLRDPDSVSHIMDLVFAIENGASQACGEPHGLDSALVLIAREQEGARP
jgi:tetratricopeptide (TPR) repeat protein